MMVSHAGPIPSERRVLSLKHRHTGHFEEFQYRFMSNGKFSRVLQETRAPVGLIQGFLLAAAV